MPPKAAGKEKSKAEPAKKQKLVEDKTFGLKNKNKSKNVQKYVQSVQQSVTNAVKPNTDAKATAKKEEEEAARDKELNELFKVAISQPKVLAGMMELMVALNILRYCDFHEFWNASSFEILRPQQAIGRVW